MRIIALMIGLAWGLVLAQSVSANDRAGMVVLDVENGDTAFALSRDRTEAWWLKGDCKAAIPLDRSETSADRMVGQPQSADVSLGDRTIRLTQQFRFDLTTDDVSVSIYNSVRGGWATVPTKRDRACESSACRARTELPEC